MVKPLTNHELHIISDLIELRSGIVLGDHQEYLVESRLSELADEIGVDSFSQLSQRMMADEQLTQKVIDLMTIKETLWFRDDSCWKTLQAIIIPDLIRKIENGTKTIRIWSAACSTGQEPYSFMILLDEILTKAGRKEMFQQFDVLGTDISKTALSIAAEGCYDSFTVKRGLSEEKRDAYFEKMGNKYALATRIRQQVRFQYLNLLELAPGHTRFDLIFCRNVAIYFSTAIKKKLFAKLATLLNSDGFLILGATESMFGISEFFETAFHENGIYYRFKNRGQSPLIL